MGKLPVVHMPVITIMFSSLLWGSLREYGVPGPLLPTGPCITQVRVVFVFLA